MNFLGRFLKGIESVEQDLYDNNKKIIKLWNQYIESFPEKEKLVNSQSAIFPSSIYLTRLKELINSEMVDISEEEVSEQELIVGLNEIDHDYEIRDLHRLQETLDYAETRYKYAYNLIMKIHSCLRTESHILDKMMSSSSNFKYFYAYLVEEISLEKRIIEKIRHFDEEIPGLFDRLSAAFMKPNPIKNALLAIRGPEKFNKLFEALLKGEYIIKNLDEKKGAVLEAMRRSDEKGYLVRKWIDAVFIKIKETEYRDLLEKQHYYDDFEFINSSKFVDFAGQIIRSISPRASDSMIELFVHDFRNAYNRRGI